MSDLWMGIFIGVLGYAGISFVAETLKSISSRLGVIIADLVDRRI